MAQACTRAAPGASRAAHGMDGRDRTGDPNKQRCAQACRSRTLYNCLSSDCFRVCSSEFVCVSDGICRASADSQTNSACAADGLAQAVGAHGAYGGIVLCIVQPHENNIADQRLTEYTLWHEYGVRVVRRSLAELSTCATLNSSGTMFVDGSPVAVAYFRAGFCPTEYPTELEWDARQMIEASDAIKSPSAAWQLAGTKKIQQVIPRKYLRY